MKLRTLVVAAATLAILLTIPVAQAFAYGHADQPLAQIEVSGNCNDPSFPLCAPPPAGVGTGGIWLWIEIDANNTGDVAGAGCGHVVGGIGGPGGAGAGSIKGDITWVAGTTADLGNVEFVFGTDSGGNYYLVTLPDGEILAFPMTTGHYSFHPVAAVTIQLQVAP